MRRCQTMQWCGCRDCHISCQVIHFLSENLNNKVLATSPCDLEDHSSVFDMNYWMFGQLSGFGETGHSGHAPSLSALRWNQMWICWRCGCIKGPGQKFILPNLDNKPNLDNLQLSVTQMFKCITRHSSIWITNNSIHSSLQSQLPKLVNSKRRNITLLSSMAMYSVMRDIH